jgi:hypothetical protein
VSRSGYRHRIWCTGVVSRTGAGARARARAGDGPGIIAESVGVAHFSFFLLVALGEIPGCSTPGPAGRRFDISHIWISYFDVWEVKLSANGKFNEFLPF